MGQGGAWSTREQGSSSSWKILSSRFLWTPWSLTVDGTLARLVTMDLYYLAIMLPFIKCSSLPIFDGANTGGFIPLIADLTFALDPSSFHYLILHTRTVNFPTTEHATFKVKRDGHTARADSTSSPSLTANRVPCHSPFWSLPLPLFLGLF